MEIEINAVQTMDGKKESITQIGTGKIENYEKGTILSWKIPNEPLQYHMTILENKILLKNQNQTMTFELGKTTKSRIQTQYGRFDISVITNHIEVIRENNIIQRIYLVYEISIEGTNSYQNEIEIRIK